MDDFFLSKVDNLNFKTYDLDSLFSLSEVHLDEIILKVVVRFWEHKHITHKSLSLLFSRKYQNPLIHSICVLNIDCSYYIYLFM